MAYFLNIRGCDSRLHGLTGENFDKLRRCQFMFIESGAKPFEHAQHGPIAVQRVGMGIEVALVEFRITVELVN